MNDERFRTMPVARAAPARKPASWWSASELPAYLEAKHCRRVANFALMVTVLVVAVVLVDYFTIGDDKARSGNIDTQAVVFAISAALFLVARSHRFSHSLVLKLSLVYEVLLCAVLSVVAWLGVLTPRLDDYLVVSIFHSISVVVAVYGSSLIYGLHRDVAEARELGSYRLEERLGMGGMGEVWRARQWWETHRPPTPTVIAPSVE